MHRHPALRNLSSDHHIGLVLARKARQAAKGSIHDQQNAWTDLVDRFQVELDTSTAVYESALPPSLCAILQACG